MKFKVGEKVAVRTYKYQPKGWNIHMFNLVGQVVTIRSNDNTDYSWPYTIEEDSQWVWREKDFVSLLVDVNDPNYIFMNTVLSAKQIT